MNASTTTAITAFHGRNLMWKLQALPGYEMRGTRCVSCSQGKRTIRYVGGFAILGTLPQVVLFLLTNKGIDLCDACLALATEISLDEVRRVIASVEMLEEFDRREGVCTICARVKPVICGVPLDEYGHADAHHVEQIVTGTLPYRGWRLDLLSYQTRSGWRPFVLVKGPADARVPDAPSLLGDTFPTKAEADAYGLKTARDWIDKRFTD